ncbi:MAG: hypothetical protein KatS3mg068_0566 [Candidatus Sericytochromatia bacterium]|nr:MAG: hypothetical protein KatS3mg068_0566 [Candidatus Sericytochromatia bacterium]
MFIINASGLETHICIHKSGHISFETVSSNGNCLDIKDILSYSKLDLENHIKKHVSDPCTDILISKYNKIQENNLNLDDGFLNDYGEKVVYNLEVNQDFDYISSNEFKNIQKIPIENKSQNIRTFILLN